MYKNMLKGSQFISSSRSRISLNWSYSSGHPQIGCRRRHPHRNQAKNNLNSSRNHCTHHTPPPRSTHPSKTDLSYPTASVCFLLRFSNSKRIFSMPVSSFIPIHAAMFIMFEHPLFFNKITKKTRLQHDATRVLILRGSADHVAISWSKPLFDFPWPLVRWGGPIDPWVSVSRWVKNVIFFCYTIYTPWN